MRYQVLAALGGLMLAGAARADLLISEIMYDPAGGNEYEYIELYNRGAAPIDLAGYVLTDDPGQTSPNSVTLAGGSVAPGETAVLVRIDTARLLVNYESAWGALNFVEVTPWPVFTNAGDVVQLLDPGAALVAAVNYGAGNGYPPPNDSASIYMRDVAAADPYGAANWALSRPGVDGARSGSAPRSGDVGSPGVIPEPATIVLLAAGVAGCRRRG